MKITKQQLKQIINEEIDSYLAEQDGPTQEECNNLKGAMGRYKPENPTELQVVRKCKELYPDPEMEK